MLPGHAVPVVGLLCPQFHRSAQNRKRAKPEFTMARNTNDEAGDERCFPRERIRRLLVGLRHALALTEGRPQNFEDLEQLTGRSRETIRSWYEGAPLQQVEFLFSLLERIPPTERQQLIDRACRIHPTILHPILSHDPLAVLRLEKILRQTAGFSLIRGQEFPAAFLFAAIANSIHLVRRGPVCMYGIDTQESPWASSRGVFNTHQCRNGNQLKQIIHQIKSAQDGSVILLGGEWATLSGLGAELRRLSSRCNVIATEPHAVLPNPLRFRPEHTQVITVARVREQPEWLAIAFQPLGA